MNRALGIMLVGLTASAVWAAEEGAGTAPAPAAAARPEMRALRVADGTIQVDGDDRDWQAFGTAFAAARTVAAFPTNLSYANADRGVWGGPNDFSLEAWVAADSDNLYVLAHVHDQLLFNDADPKEPYLGDDFEVFIDANPLAAQFAALRNENVRQFIFLPAWVNPALPAGEVWKAEENAGVKMASRLHPWGYTIEVQIPKALFPNWAEAPDLSSIGFDIMAGDADSPGMDGPHGAIKYAGFLLSPGNHFQTSEKLARLQLDSAIAVPSHAAAPDAEDQNTSRTAAERRAEAILEQIADQGAAAAARAVASGDRVVRKAGLLELAKRPKLAAPTAALLDLCKPNPDGHYVDADLVNYALVALAERKDLPAKTWSAFYRNAPDPQVRLTWVWCLGRNGDRGVVPELESLLTDQNLRVRVKAAIALSELGDAACVPALDQMKANDPHNYGRGAAEQALQRLPKKKADKPTEK